MINKSGFLIVFSLFLGFCVKADEPAFILRASTSMEKLFPDAIPDGWIKPGTGDSISVSACRKESESFQIAVIPFKEINGLKWSVSSDSIPVECVRINPVGFVEITKTGGKMFKNYPEDEIFTGLWPDPIYSTRDSVDNLEPGKVQPLWVTIDVPADVRAGEHKIKITVTSEDAGASEITVTLKVWNFELPDTMSLRICNYIQSPFLSQYYPEISGSDAQWELRKKFIKMALDNRITPVELDPLRDIGVTYDKAEKKYSFDFTLHKRLLSFMFNENLRKGNLASATSPEFSVGSPSRRTYQKELNFSGERYFGAEYKDFLEQYVGAWKKMMLENKWYDRAGFLVLDEAGKEEDFKRIRHLTAILKESAAEPPTFGAINFQPAAEALKDSVDIEVPGLFSNFNDANLPFFRELQKNGRTVWGYICYKTSDIDFQSLDHRMLFWLCSKYDLKGFLYWGTINWFQRNSPKAYPNFYTSDPKTRWPNAGKQWKHTSIDLGIPGDGYFIYPSPEGAPWSSVRLENIRDGIEDYEYFCILKQKVASMKKNGTVSVSEIERGEKLLEIGDEIIQGPCAYTRDWKKLTGRRAEIAEFIEKYLNQ